MDRDDVLRLLIEVREGRTDPSAALEQLGGLGVAELGDAGDGPSFARIDHHRAVRCGFPEVVYGPGKTPSQVVAIAEEILSRAPRLLVTRVDGEQTGALLEALPDATLHERARAITVLRGTLTRAGSVAVLSAGTSDGPVAEEARVTADAMGAEVTAFHDCGVAGLHRLLSVLDEIRAVDALVVVAGMEGALPSVVGGLVDAPVIAVPTSVGYGASFEGVAPLLTMLNSCAAGVAVVNIDNGFGAGYLAAVIARRSARAPDASAS